MHALLFAGLAVLAGAQSAPLARMVPSARAGLSHQARELFNDTRDALWAEVRGKFLQDAPLPDPTALIDVARTLPNDAAAQDAAKELSAAIWQARYVQQGPRPGDDYRLLVDYAAARLDVPRQQAEAVYLAAGRPAATAACDPILTLQLRREAEIFRKKLASGTTLSKARAIAKQLGDLPAPGDPVYVTRVEPTISVNGKRIPVAGESRQARTRFPAPPPGLGPPSIEDLVSQGKLPRAFLKYSPARGSALANASKTFALSPLEECLYAVKRAFERAGYDIGWLLGFHRAYEFARHMSPEALDKLRLLKLAPQDTQHIDTLPRGALIVYPPRVCGASAGAGHIELVTQQGIPELGVPTVAESDAPHKVNFRCVRQAMVYLPVDDEKPGTAPAAADSAR